MTFIVMFIGFAAGFYLGVLVMCMLAMARKRETTESIVLDEAA
jgi:allophanate hydrolase subunit 1